MFWDAPFRALLWDEQWMKGLVEGLFQVDWQVYVRSPQVDQAIQNTIRANGVIYLICALASLLIHLIKKWAYPIIYFGSFSLLFLAFLESKEHFFYLGQFFEYSLQFSTPVFFVLAHKYQRISPRLLLWIKIAAAITFVSHGLFAIGFYPRPGYFVEMVMNIVGVGQGSAVQILILAGILDFIVGVLIFFPKKIALPATAYMVIWGFGTTAARIWAYFHPEIAMDVMHQWFYQSLFRAPHFLMPALIFLTLWKQE